MCYLFFFPGSKSLHYLELWQATSQPFGVNVRQAGLGIYPEHQSHGWLGAGSWRFWKRDHVFRQAEHSANEAWGPILAGAGPGLLPHHELDHPPQGHMRTNETAQSPGVVLPSLPGLNHLFSGQLEGCSSTLRPIALLYHWKNQRWSNRCRNPTGLGLTFLCFSTWLRVIHPVMCFLNCLTGCSKLLSNSILFH